MLIKVFITRRTSCVLHEVFICLLKIKDFNLANFYWMENEKIILKYRNNKQIKLPFPMEPVQVSKVKEFHEYSSDFTILGWLYPFCKHFELLLVRGTKLGARITERSAVPFFKYCERGTHYKDTQKWNCKAHWDWWRLFIIHPFIFKLSFERVCWVLKELVRQTFQVGTEDMRSHINQEKELQPNQERSYIPSE